MPLNPPVHVSEIGMKGTGWLPPRPDLRDYTPDSPVPQMVAGKTLADTPPSKADLRQWFPAVYDQGQLGSCTANAAVGVLEYLQNKAYNLPKQSMSRMFVYKASRNLLGVTGDTGAYLRTAMGAMVLLGAPPEKYWPYTVNTDPSAGKTFDEEPTSFVYSVADNFEGLTYFCHDPISAKVPTDAVQHQKVDRQWVAGDVRLLRVQLVRVDRHPRFLPVPGSERAGPVGTRRGRVRVRRRQGDHQHPVQRDHDRRTADPQLVGIRVG